MGLLDFFRKKKPETRSNGYTNWIPFSSAISDFKGQYLAGNLPQVRRALQLYSNLINSTPLRAISKETGKEIDHYLLRVLDKPSRFLNKNEFFSRLVEAYFLEGNFYCFIKTNETGQIVSLLNFLPGTMYAYSSGRKKGAGDNADPLQLDEQGSYYYQSQFGEGKNAVINKYDPEDIWHIKSTWQSQDLLNGSSLYEAYTQSVEMAQDSLGVSSAFAKSGMVGPVLISGVETESPEQRKETADTIRDFFENKKNFLTLNEGTEVKDLMVKQPADFLRLLTSVSSLHLSRILSVPIELTHREDASTNAFGGQALKEVFRFWVKTSGRSFLNLVETKLNELADDVTFEFKVRSTQASDMRELSMSVGQLVSHGVLTPDEAKKWLNIGGEDDK